jgi:hypothetical protein
MHSSLHSCTFGQKAPRRSLASLEVRGAAKPLTQVRKILMNRKWTASPKTVARWPTDSANRSQAKLQQFFKREVV